MDILAKRYMITVLLIGLFVATVPAHAQDRTGWGVSAGIGTSRIKDKDGADEFSGAGFGMALDVEYRLSSNIALGLGGFSLGRAEDSFGGVDTEIEARGWEFFGRVIYPVSDTAEFYGRVGTGTYFVDIDPGSVSFQDAVLGSGFVDFGFGVDFGRKEKLAFRLEGRYLNGGNDEAGALMLFGFNYLF